mmetsp:Transcript_19463/g.51491  ORF Transcript_19463/g.51491 Transcript_19463/m.51491 type:complete len:702 (+) Transcript_19463:6-2111(+)
MLWASGSATASRASGGNSQVYNVQALDEGVVVHRLAPARGDLADGRDLRLGQKRSTSLLQLRVDLAHAALEVLDSHPVRGRRVEVRKERLQRRAADPDALQQLLEHHLVELHRQTAGRHGADELENADAVVAHARVLDVGHEADDVAVLDLRGGGQLLEAALQLLQGEPAVVVGVPEPEGVGVALPGPGDVRADALGHRAPHGGRHGVPAHEGDAEDGAVQREGVLLHELRHRLVQGAGVLRRHVDVEAGQEVRELLQGDSPVAVGVEELLQALHRAVQELLSEHRDLAHEVRLLGGAVLVLRPADLEAVQEAHVPDLVLQAPHVGEPLQQLLRDHLGADRLKLSEHHLHPLPLRYHAGEVRVDVAEAREELVLVLADPLHHELLRLDLRVVSGVRRHRRRGAGRGRGRRGAAAVAGLLALGDLVLGLEGVDEPGPVRVVAAGAWPSPLEKLGELRPGRGHVLAQLQALAHVADEDAPSVAGAAHVVAGREDGEGLPVVGRDRSPETPGHLVRPDDEGQAVPVAELGHVLLQEAVAPAVVAVALPVLGLDGVRPEKVEEEVPAWVLHCLDRGSYPIDVPHVLLERHRPRLARAVHGHAAVQHGELPAAAEGALHRRDQRHQGEHHVAADVPDRAAVQLAELALELGPEAEVDAALHVLMVPALNDDAVHLVPLKRKEQQENFEGVTASVHYVAVEQVGPRR